MIGLLTPAEYVECVEHAFRMHGEGRVYMEPKGHIVLDRYKGEWEVMPSWIEEPEAAACKWVSIREDNARYELPAVFSILVYTHPETGFPIAICDGSVPHADAHRRLRGRVGPVAGPQGLEGARILGTGSVGQGTLATCDAVFPWQEVRVWSRTQESVDRFLASQAPATRTSAGGHDGRGGRRSRARTSSSPGHTRAAGSSTRPGSSPAHTSPPSGPTSRASRSSIRGSFSAGAIFVDDIRQCIARRRDQRRRCARGSSPRRTSPGDRKVICGELEGRQTDDQVTVFDSTGIALQDSATVPLKVERAVAAGVGIEKKMIST